MPHVVNSQLYLKSNLLFAGSNWEVFFARFGRPVLVADHLRSPENMGALIRLADNVGASEVVLLGSADGIRQNRIRRVAASSAGNLNWKFMTTDSWLATLEPNASIVAIETTIHSTNLFETPLPDRPIFVVGNEVSGIDNTLLNLASVCVHIPVPGPTRSLNVSHAAAVVLYEWLRQKLQHR